MNIASLVSTIKDDLYSVYHIEWDVRVVEMGEGDVNLAIFPSAVAGECVIGFNLYLFYTRLDMEMAVENEPPLMIGVFRGVERNGKANIAQIEAFETLLRGAKGHLIYRVNGGTFSDAPLKEHMNERWSYFSLRYESDYLDVHTRLDFDYQEIRHHVLNFAGLILLFSSYQAKEELALYEEGKSYMETSVRYERNPINRALCLENKGYCCSVCGIDMEKVYGSPGREFIEVHHSIPVSEYGQERLIDPLAELFPVCPNCHAMLHRRKPPYSIDELKQLMNDASGERGKK